jgi:hypothetical protein
MVQTVPSTFLTAPLKFLFIAWVVGAVPGQNSFSCSLCTIIGICGCHPLLGGFVVALLPPCCACVVYGGYNCHRAAVDVWCCRGYLAACALLGKCFVIVAA